MQETTSSRIPVLSSFSFNNNINDSDTKHLIFDVSDDECEEDKKELTEVDDSDSSADGDFQGFLLCIYKQIKR